MDIYLASDHAGLDLKEALKAHLLRSGHDVEDMGPHVLDPDDDYPDFVIPAARKVAEDPDNRRGIVIGGSGQGEAIAANKVKGVRAGVYYGGSLDIVRLLREHNGANVLALGGRFLSFAQGAEAADLFLQTPFAGKRHERRIRKISEAESR